MIRNPQCSIESGEDAVVTDSEHDEDCGEGVEDDFDVPDEFICPLTLELFSDPVMSRRGLNFERKAIIEWLDQGNETCPLTRDPLGYRGLVPNAKLRSDVDEWKRKHGYEVIKPQERERELRSRDVGFRTEGKPVFVFLGDEEGNAVEEVDSPPPSSSSLENDRSGDQDHVQRRERSSRSRSNSQRQRARRFPRRRSTERSTGLSPATQRPRFISLIGEAFRRPPLPLED